MCGDCALDPVDTSEGYLNLAKQCMERVQKMTLLSASTLKFNHGQCRYLAKKLNLAVEYACSVLEALNNEQVGPQKVMVHSLEAFKLLYMEYFLAGNSNRPLCRGDTPDGDINSSSLLGSFISSWKHPPWPWKHPPWPRKHLPWPRITPALATETPALAMETPALTMETLALAMETPALATETPTLAMEL
jgi:hypothetical protein